MRRSLLVLAVFFSCATASADMIEIKGEGFFNGSIESENDNEVTFKDAKGQVRTLARKDVLFMERQAESAPAQKAALKIGQALKEFKPEKKPEKKTGKSPSSSAKKEKAARGGSSSGGADVTGALRAMAKAERAMAANQRRMDKALKEAEGGYGSEGASQKKDAKKGRFGSLSAESDFGAAKKTKKESS